MMRDLFCLYQEMLPNRDASDEIINNVKVMKLKEEICNETCEQRNSKFILLKLDRHVGKALLGVTENSLKYVKICLIKRRYSIEIFVEKSNKVLSHHHCFI